MQWTSVGDSVLRSGDTWTTDGFRPGARGLRKISKKIFHDMVPSGTKVVFTVAHVGLPFRVFEGTKHSSGVKLRIVATKGVCSEEELLQSADAQVSAIVFEFRNANSFTTQDVSKMLFCRDNELEQLVRGHTYRNKTAPNKEAFEELFGQMATRIIDLKKQAFESARRILKKAERSGAIIALGRNEWVVVKGEACPQRLTAWQRNLPNATRSRSYSESTEPRSRHAS